MTAPALTIGQSKETNPMHRHAPGESTQIATRGAFWNIGLAFANKGFTLIGQVVLAWLLTPKDMGLAGMAVAMAGIVAFMNASGVTDVLIQRGNFKKEGSQAFWLSMTLTLITSVFIATLIPITSWMGHPELAKMLFILVFLPIADALSPILSAALKSELNFKHFAVSNFLAGVTYTLCAVLLAFNGFGAYSIIFPVIPRALVNWISMIPKAKFPKIEKPKISVIKKLFRPALSISFTGFLNALQQQVPIFCVGLVTDFTVTGHFSWGWQVASQSVFLLAVNLRQVLMPTLAKLKNDPERQASAMFRAIRAITALLTIACGLQALLARPTLELFFPEKWYPASSVITWISIGLVFQGVYVCISAWLNAAGKYKALLLVTILPVLMSSVLAYWGALLKNSEGAAIGSGLGLAISSIGSLTLIPRKTLKDQLKRFVIPLLISFFAFGVFFYFEINQLNIVKSLIFSFLYFCVSSIAWWHWSKGIYSNVWKSIVERIYFSNGNYVKNKRTKNNKVPNFFIIGGPKCGTTALANYLSGHPNIFISPTKEPEYFDSDLSRRTKMNLKAYLSLFSKVDPKKHKVIGEASTSYLFSKKAVPEILKFNRKAKIIVMVRNPVDLVHAWHSEMVFWGAEDIVDFERAWKNEKMRKKGRRIPQYCWEPKKLFYSEWGKLGTQVEKVFKLTKRANVRVIVFDDFVKNTPKTYEDILRFLNLKTDGRNKFPKINENRKIIFLWPQRYLGSVVNLVRMIRAKFGWPIGFGILNKIILLNSIFAKRDPITKKLRGELNLYYKRDVAKLSKLLNRNLTYWTANDNKMRKARF